MKIILNTTKCKVCERSFKSEKCLKDHIFNQRVKDKDHLNFKDKLRKQRSKKATRVCPVCKKKFVKNIVNHFYHCKDCKKHDGFLEKQREFIVKKFLEGKSYYDIKAMKSKYVKNFGEKHIKKGITKTIDKREYQKLSKIIHAKKKKGYWKKNPQKRRKKIMESVREAQWGKLSEKQRKKHPWVIAGRKASLRSTKRGSKNQAHAHRLLLEELPKFNWEYNYVLKDSWHIDIACPKEKIFIEWDGRHHRIPIHGISYLKNRQNKDKVKNKIVIEILNGCLIRVKDDGRENKDFVCRKVGLITDIIRMNKSKGKRIIYM